MAEPISLALLQKYAPAAPSGVKAGRLPPKESNSTTQRPRKTEDGKLDVEPYLNHYGVVVKTTKTHGTALLFVLEECPFNPSHKSGESSIGQQPDGKLFFQCFHDSCKSYTWHDAREQISGSDSLSEFMEGARVEDQGGGNKTLSVKLVELAESMGMELFHSPDQQAYASHSKNDHVETCPIESKEFAEIIKLAFYEKHKKIPNSSATKDAVAILTAKGLNQGPEIKVHLRSAAVDGVHYIDLVNANRQVVEVSPDGWRVINTPPVKFRRTPHMLALPTPTPLGIVSGASLRERISRYFLEHFNIPAQVLTLIIAWILEAFRPETPYPLLILSGEQGTAKSTIQERLRSFIDPSTVPLRAAFKSTEDIFVSANNNYVLSYNNLSFLNKESQDALCSVCTGGGFASRELYTNACEIVYSVTRPVIINGISTLATSPDLLDRAIQIELPVIEASRRKPESVLHADFEKIRPELFSLLLSAFSAALRDLPSVHLTERPRMADFAILGQALTQALEWPESFAEIYSRNRNKSLESAVESSPVATAIIGFLDKNPEGYKGPLSSLKINVERYKGDSDGWPKSAKGLSDALRRIQPAMRELGVLIVRGEERHSDGHYWSISKKQ